MGVSLILYGSAKDRNIIFVNVFCEVILNEYNNRARAFLWWFIIMVGGEKHKGRQLSSDTHTFHLERKTFILKRTVDEILCHRQVCDPRFENRQTSSKNVDNLLSSRIDFWIVGIMRIQATRTSIPSFIQCLFAFVRCCQRSFGKLGNRILKVCCLVLEFLYCQNV